MSTDKVRLTKEREPYLATFYPKALDSRSADSILGDTFADEASRRIDFAFEKLKLPKGASVTVPMRAKHLDSWTREFLDANPIATVLHLGPGLDSRVFRIGPAPTVRWYDVDLPDVIELRRRIYPPRDGYAMIGSSVTDLRWLDEIPRDRPTLVVAEGLVMYLAKEEGLALFNRITELFPRGQLIFDAYDRILEGLLNLAAPLMRMNVRLRWAIDDPTELEQRVRKLRLVTAIPFVAMPEVVERLARTQSRAQRAVSRWIYGRAWAQRMIRHLRYEF